MGNHISDSKHFFRAHGTELQEFLYRAQKDGYGSPNADPVVKNDGTFSTSYTEGPWRYTDSWCGGEPFAGISVVWYKDVVCWSMVYWGRIMPNPYIDSNGVTRCLSEALQAMEKHRPWRGPSRFKGSNPRMQYFNKWIGGLRRFSGEETICTTSKSQEILYKANYIGGIVNKDVDVGKYVDQDEDAAMPGVEVVAIHD